MNALEAKSTQDQRIDLVEKLLAIYGQAMRWDYSDLNGKHIQCDLDYISGVLVDTSPALPSLETCLEILGIKPNEFGGYEWAHK